MKNMQGFLKFLGFQYAFHIFHNKPFWGYLCYYFSITYSKVATSVVFISFAVRREILSRRAANYYIGLERAYFLDGFLNIHQISTYCRVCEIFSIYSKRILPIIKRCNYLHTGFLKAKA